MQRLHSLIVCSCRGLFVIDDKGILRQITINDLPVGRSVDETLRLVQAFQHTDKYGEGEFNLATLRTHMTYRTRTRVLLYCWGVIR